MPGVRGAVLDQIFFSFRSVEIACFVFAKKPDRHQGIQQQLSGARVCMEAAGDFRRRPGACSQRSEDVKLYGSQEHLALPIITKLKNLSE